MNDSTTEGSGLAREVTPRDLEQVAGGDGECVATVTISGPGFTIEVSAANVGDALIGAYEGAVGATSHVIERVANSF